MADKNRFQTVEEPEGGFELVEEASRVSRAGWSPTGTVNKALAVAAALALMLALAGCSTAAEPKSSLTMEASDTNAPTSSSSSTQQETKQTDTANGAGTEGASSSTASSNGDVDNPLTEADIESLVFQNGLGAFDSAQLIQGSDGHWYWSVVTRDTANEPHTWTVDANGNFTSADSGSDGVDNNLTEADVKQIVFDQGLGAYRYASLIKGDDGVWYWQVCVGDIYDNDHFLLVDPYGNVTEQ